MSKWKTELLVLVITCNLLSEFQRETEIWMKWSSKHFKQRLEVFLKSKPPELSYSSRLKKDRDFNLRKDDQVIDQVSSYFGMRKVTRQLLPGTNYEYVFVNNRPTYLLGALNQSFTPEGVYTFLDDDQIKKKCQLYKEIDHVVFRSTPGLFVGDLILIHLHAGVIPLNMTIW